MLLLCVVYSLFGWCLLVVLRFAVSLGCLVACVGLLIAILWVGLLPVMLGGLFPVMGIVVVSCLLIVGLVIVYCLVWVG